MKGVIRAISEGDWREPVVGCGYEVAETVHTMGETKRAFRLIVKRWLKPGLDLFEEGRYAYHVIGFKRRVCPRSLWSKTVETVRWALIQVAGRMVRHAGRTILRLVMDHPTWALFCDIRRNCFDLSFLT